MSGMQVSKAKLTALEQAAADAEERKTWAWEHAASAYEERDLLACALARCYPSHRMVHTQRAKSKEPRNVVCIHTPAGQLNFMLTDEMNDRLSDLPVESNHWDGHKRPEKRARLAQLGRPLPQP